MQYQLYNVANPLGDVRFDAVFSLMDRSFPSNEHRVRDRQRALLGEPAYAVLTGEREGKILAFMGVWEFDEFRFIEHFAVDPALRGQGIGGEMLRAYLSRDTRRVVLEVELPNTDFAVRRIGFYQRMGLTLSDFPYTQPPLNPGDEWLPLLLMSSGGALTDAEAAAVRDTLYRVVYRWTAG